MNIWQALLHGLGQILAFLYDLIPNYGLAIILFTIVTKVALLPLAIKQIRGQKAMQELSSKMQGVDPELQRIKQKYKGDKQKIQEETMRLYQEHGINPMGGLMGCLPMFLQFPIMIALFSLLRVCPKGTPRCVSGTRYLPQSSALLAAIMAGNTQFLGMDLLVTPTQALRTVGILASLPYFLMIAITTFTSFYAARQIQRAQPPPPANPTPQQQQMQSMQRMFKYFPLMIGIFGLSFPAGLNLYWATGQIWQIVQQYFMVTRKLEAQSGARSQRPTLGSMLKRILPAGVSSTFSPSPNGKSKDEVEAEAPPPAAGKNGGRARSNRSKKRKRKKGRRR